MKKILFPVLTFMCVVFTISLHAQNASKSDFYGQSFDVTKAISFDESEWERRYYGYVFGAIAGGEVFNKNHQIFTINGRSDRVAERVGEKRI